MKFILGERGSGKSTQLMRECERANGIFVVQGSDQKRFAEDLARRCGLHITVCTEDEVLRNLGRDWNTPIFIDDVQNLLERIYRGYNIVMVASAGELL